PPPPLPLFPYTTLFRSLLNEMRLNHLQAEFLAAVSHELKTPLASLELASSLLRAGNIEAAEAERLWDSHAAELKRLKEEVETLRSEEHTSELQSQSNLV